MNGKAFFDDVEIELSRIGITQQNFSLYQQLRISLADFSIIDFFGQIKKNDKGEGLALEMMFFDKKVIHDIVITRTTLDFITVPLNKIKLVYLESSYDEEVKDNNATNRDKVRLSISYGGELKLFYTATTKRFKDLLRIKQNLIQTIPQ